MEVGQVNERDLSPLSVFCCLSSFYGVGIKSASSGMETYLSRLDRT